MRTRTRDPNLGKVVLYQLSYSRETDEHTSDPPAPAQRPLALRCRRKVEARGIEPLTS